MVAGDWYLMSLAITLMFFSSAPLAQVTQSGCAPGNGSESVCVDSRIELSKITVTATRRELPLKKAPISITALSGDRLKEMGAATFADYARSVPGLSFTDGGFGGEKYIIRGVTSDALPEVRATTAVYFDETPVTHAGGLGLPYSPDPVLVDVARVEVLRGPQGTLFGSGSMGGAIRIISEEPDLYTVEGFAEVGISRIDHGGGGYDIRAMFNVPLADNQAGIRAVAYYRDLDGWMDNKLLNHDNVNNDETTGLRLAGTWFNQGHLTVNGKIVYQDRQSDGSNIDQGDPPNTQRRAVNEPNQDKWTLANFNIEYEFDWGKLISTSSLLDRVIDTKIDVTGFFDAVVFPSIQPDLHTTVAAVNKDDVKDFVQEFRLSSTTKNRLDWLLGLYYQDQDFKFSQDFPAPGFDQQTGGLADFFGASDNLFASRTARSLKQIAVFADATWAFSEKLQGNVGSRWFRFEHDSRMTGTGLINGGPVQERTSANETGYTPKLGLSYFANQGVTLYGTVANGYRPGGTNETGGEDFPGCREELAGLGRAEIPRLFESDSLWSYEFGIKSNWAEQRLYVNAAAYYIDWTDIQTTNNLACGAAFLENAGKATSKGLEIEVAAYPVRNLELALNGSYTNAKLSADVPNLGGTRGDKLPGVPGHTFGGSISWFFKAFAGTTGSIRVDYQYVGDSYNAINAAIRQKNPSYSLSNLRVTFQRNHWETSLFINNLFDQRAIVSVHDNFVGQYVTTAQPLTFGVGIRFNY